MSTLSPRPLLPTFLPSINALLATLALPFTIDHPTDLTPSLLLAIFESLIDARLPIPASVRQSRTPDAKSRAMLVLLGVLECDVLRGGTASVDADDRSVATSHADDSVLAGAGGVSVDGWVDDIGLGDVDPEQLADGGWEETLFVGELLCWLARRRGVLPRTRSSRRSAQSRALYSYHHSYGTEYGEGEGDTADFSTSLLLGSVSDRKARSPRPPSPSTSMHDPDADVDADFSDLSHITDVPRHPLVHSPELSLSASATTGTDLSIRARSISSRTSVPNARDELEELEDASQDMVQIYDSRRMMQDAEEDDDRPPTFRPRCIHELEDPSYVRTSSSFDSPASHERISEDEDDPSRDEEDAEGDMDDAYAPPTPTPRRVRLTGWIDDVDTATELDHFASSRVHSRSRAFHTSAGSGSGPSSRSSLHTYTHTSETPKLTSTPRLKSETSPPRRSSSSKTRTRLRISPSPSPPPSPPLPVSSTRPPRRLPSDSPPSSPPTHSDPPFDVSFSMLNNTSTPAKPRPPRRRQHPTTDMGTYVEVDSSKSKSRGNAGTEAGTGTGAGRPRLGRDRSPSYTPSPPSFVTPGSLRSGGANGNALGVNTSTRAGSTRTSGTGTKTRLGVGVDVSASNKTTTAMRQRRSSSPPRSTVPVSSSTATKKGKSPPPAIPSCSTTATTNTLLTERARLLTELAALKRVRREVVGQRVGVGV